MTLQLCVLTLNCWGIPYISEHRKIRMNAIAEELNSGKYNIVTLQEMWSQDDFEMIKAKTANVLPYAHYFYSGVLGSGICILSSFRIIDTFYHQWSINGYIHRIQHGDWFGGKGIGLCKVRTNDGIIINVYSAHLHAEYNPDSDDYKAHRILQAFEMGKFISFTSSESDVTILGGDLNSEPKDLAYKIIIDIAGLQDSFSYIADKTVKFNRSTGTNEHKENTYTPKAVAKQQPEGKRIDYVLYKSNKKIQVDVANYEHPLPQTVPGESMSYSDHEAVVATFQVKKTARCVQDNEICINEKIMHNSRPASKVYAEDLKESIRICEDAILSLDNHKRSYTMLSVTCFVLLLAVIKMNDISNLSITSGLILTIQLILMITWLFGLLMATLWNNIERNSIYAGKLAMEIHIGAL